MRMNVYGWLQLALYVAALFALTRPLGCYLVRVLETRERLALTPVFGPLENRLYRLLRLDPAREQDWRSYTSSMLNFTLASGCFTYAVLRLQNHLPLNPQGLGPVAPPLAFNTAVSFTTNTNWQAYGGEVTLSYFSQMVALTLQNFASAAVGIVVAAALVRGIARHSVDTVGHFWVDFIRVNLYVMLPASFAFAVLLLSQGVPMNFSPYTPISTIDGQGTQLLAQGPVASQEAIKILGTNGGGFMNANSAHPFENPTPLTNFLQMLAILALPSALTYYLGRVTGH